MASGGTEKTAAGNLRHARLSDVYLWVKRFWEKIFNEIIIKSFKKCKISNKLDDLEITDDDSNGDDDVDGDDDIDSEDNVSIEGDNNEI